MPFLMILACVLIAPCLRADDEQKSKVDPSADMEELKDIFSEYQHVQREAMHEYRAAKPADREKILADLKKKSLPFAVRFLKFVDKNPKDPDAMNALAWIVVSLDSGRETEKATQILLKDHGGGLGELCLALAQSKLPAGEKLLRTVLDQSADHKAQGHAAFGLAVVLKAKSEATQLTPAQTQKLSTEAEALFGRVVEKYADVGDLAERARGDLFELRNLAIGKVAPDISGEDSESKKFKLSDYRGKVVVLDFWASWCGPCMAMVPHERELVKRLEGRPFAFLGVNLDEKKQTQKKTETENQMSWRSFFDGQGGPISKEWNIHSIPAIFVLDSNGVIRYKGLRGKAMDQAVDALLRDVPGG